MRSGGILSKIAFDGWKRNHAASSAINRWRDIGSTNNFYKRLGCLRQKRIKFFHRGGDAHVHKRVLNAGDFAQVAIGSGHVRLAAE